MNTLSYNYAIDKASVRRGNQSNAWPLNVDGGHDAYCLLLCGSMWGVARRQCERAVARRDNADTAAINIATRLIAAWALPWRSKQSDQMRAISDAAVMKLV